MFDILIVDDEVLVRTHIKLLLSTITTEFRVCAEATDGVTALNQIAMFHPHIIFSDMRMPNMDGLELCQKVKEQYPEILFLALSNYDDYSYVRGSLKNGALDYILKHKLNEAYLSTVLADLKKYVNQQASSRLFPDNTRSVLREKFMLDLLGHVYLSSDEIMSTIKMLDISLDLTNVVPIILTVDDYAKYEYTNNLSQLAILNFSICNIGNEILSQYRTGFLTHIERDTYCILVSFAQEAGQAKINEVIDSILHQLSVNYKNFLNISTSFCVGEMTYHIIDIYQAYAKAFEAMRLQFYAKKQSILHATAIKQPQASLTGLDYTIEKKLHSLVLQGNYEETKEVVETLFQSMITRNENRSNVQMICTDLLSIITRVSKKNMLDLTKIIKQKVPPDQIFHQLTTLIELREWFLDCFQNTCTLLCMQMSGDSSYVKSAIAYLNRDYAKAISLQSIASEIGISVGYLSTIFKQETGQAFSDYLNSLRITSAIHMIEAGELDFHKIADACGFQDCAYFYKVFKKRTGTTPKAYSNSILN